MVAPHSDDEALATAGIIQSAVKATAEVKIVYLTHGESNEISAIFHQKRPMLLKADFIRVGRLRRREATVAMALLGVPEKNLIFLGYPDMGLMPIWERFWQPTRPFRSFFTRLNKVVNEEDFSYGKSYSGANIVRDFEKVLQSVKPTHIFVTAPFDLNQDHQASFLFLAAALQNSKGVLTPRPGVYSYLVHEKGWPKPRKYDPSTELLPPKKRALPGVVWLRQDLLPEEIRKKEESLHCYDSQLSYSKNFLKSFIRKNELFAQVLFEKISPREKISSEAWAAEMGMLPGEEIRYGVSEKELLIQIPRVQALDQMGTFTTSIFGHKKGTHFSEMPKVKIRLFGNKLFAKDGTRKFLGPEIFMKKNKKRHLFIRIPLKNLKDPETLFVSTRTAKSRLAFDAGSWRVIQIDRIKAQGVS